MSSILPRAGTNKAKPTRQIVAFNRMLEQLAEEVLNIHFCKNSGYFVEDDVVISSLYRDAGTAGIHVNADGRARLAVSITGALKEVYFHEKYIEASSGV